MKDVQEYLRRNLIHAKSVGVHAGLQAAINRLVFNKKQQKWLIDLLMDLKAKSQEISQETAKHRDEV